MRLIGMIAAVLSSICWLVRLPGMGCLMAIITILSFVLAGKFDEPKD